MGLSYFEDAEQEILGRDKKIFFKISNRFSKKIRSTWIIEIYNKKITEFKLIRVSMY